MGMTISHRIEENLITPQTPITASQPIGRTSCQNTIRKIQNMTQTGILLEQYSLICLRVQLDMLQECQEVAAVLLEISSNFLKKTLRLDMTTTKHYLSCSCLVHL